MQGLYDVHYTQPPYATTFPQILNCLTFRPCVPVNAVIVDNTYCKTPTFINDVGAWNDTIGGNVELCPE